MRCGLQLQRATSEGGAAKGSGIGQLCVPQKAALLGLQHRMWEERMSYSSFVPQSDTGRKLNPHSKKLRK